MAVAYPKFLREFPDIFSLAEASPGRVLRAWQGLGYNRRALALLEIAKKVVADYGGVLPRDPGILKTFPGIGETTANSIAAFVWNVPTVFVETNVRRVIIHHFFRSARGISDERVRDCVARTVDKKDPREWYYALMDYGTFLGKSVPNPNRRSAHYRRQPKFKGSIRELRGTIVKLFISRSRWTEEEIIGTTGVSAVKAETALRALEKEGFLKRRGRAYML